MITAITQAQTLSNINNIKLPRPRLKNKVNLNQQSDTFAPSFCANPESLSTKIGSVIERLFMPMNKNSEKIQHYQELNANIPSAYKF